MYNTNKLHKKEVYNEHVVLHKFYIYFSLKGLQKFGHCKPGECVFLLFCLKIVMIPLIMK